MLVFALSRVPTMIAPPIPSVGDIPLGNEPMKEASMEIIENDAVIIKK